jgi:Iap family predicted aminopeptidase
MTVSTFHYNEKDKQLSEYENYFKIARTGDANRIRARLAEKGRRHFRRWLTRNGISQQREIEVNFELEQAAKRQQKYATIRRLVLRRVDKRWVAEELKPGKMRYSKRPRSQRKRA